MELRGRKLKITRSMDAEERFHQRRMGYVKYCVHMKHNVPLDSITTNWTLKHNDHVEHDMNDCTDERTRTMRNITYATGEQIDIVTENEKTEAEAGGIESTSTETTLNVAVGLQE